MERPNTSSEGSLYELVARGQKDAFFVNLDKSALVPFSYGMDTWPGTLNETRQTQPLNMVDFGRTVEWEFDTFGDIMTSVALVIDLPTWLPPTISPLNTTTLIQDANSTTYGYCQGIGAFLFESIQFYQDQVALQEFSGDFLYTWMHLQGTLNQEALALKQIGAHSGTALEIQRNATPNRLYLRLPIIGCAHPDEGGFPLVAVPGQKFRLRCKLRRLEDLVESSSSAIKPTPWSRTDLRSINSSSTVTSFIPISREKIGKPLITLETTQTYVRPELQNELKKKALEIPFMRPFENKLSLDPNDYVSVGNGGSSYITKRIDGRHPAEGILIFFQSEYDVERNRLWSITNPIDRKAYYNSMKLIVAGKDRETEWTSDVWQNLSPFTKCEKMPGIMVSWLSFAYGPTFGYRAPVRRQPSGTLNFSLADKPTLWMDIRDTLPASTLQKKTYIRAITIGWGLYIIDQKRGTLRFAN